ncbi:hypothetical protein RUR49_12860 [Pseudoxanthobacter sp. M-2]|uniref:hypothetical protein n=1 Tax=Pseudoxanthobacter sp. M-2 TaxID=3078754 RepID=UPI0038FC2E8F
MEVGAVGWLQDDDGTSRQGPFRRNRNVEAEPPADHASRVDLLAYARSSIKTDTYSIDEESKAHLGSGVLIVDKPAIYAKAVGIVDVPGEA